MNDCGSGYFLHADSSRRDCINRSNGFRDASTLSMRFPQLLFHDVLYTDEFGTLVRLPETMDDTLIIPGTTDVYQRVPRNKWGATPLDIMAQLNSGGEYADPDNKLQAATLLAIMRDPKKNRIRVTVELPGGEKTEVSWKRVKPASLSSAAGMAQDAATKKTNASAGKKTKVPRDPTMPKRPLSSYLRYQKKHYAILKGEQGMPHKEAMAKISAMWKDASDEDKAVFAEAASKDMAAWSEKMKAWKENSSK